MSKKFYKNNKQQIIVVEAVRKLLDLSFKNDTQISKETLQLICDRYCYIMDPPDKPGKAKYSDS